MEATEQDEERTRDGLERAKVEIDDLATSLAGRKIRARLFGGEADSVIADRFVLGERLGAGGMGTVWRGQDRRLDRPVAIKFLLTQVDSEQGERRLLREAQALAQLSHPNVVSVFDFGRHEDRVWVAMEYVPGRTLGSWRRELQPPWRVVLERWIEAGRGLAAVHALGLVHRDVKPGNVLLGDDGRVRLIDFGLVRLEDESCEGSMLRTGGSGDEERTPSPRDGERSGDSSPLAEEITTRGAVIGTPAYMAPEQLRDRRSSQRSDQYSLCVSLVEALGGERPFPETSVSARLEAMESGPDSEFLRALPGVIRRAIRRGLAADPEARWPSVAALLDELERGLALRRRRWAVGGVLGLVALAAGLGAGVGAGRPGPEAPNCEIGAEALPGWDEDAREQLRRSLASSDRPYAEVSAERAVATLDEWADRWLASQRRVCEATHVLELSSPAELEQRRRCLERERLSFEVLRAELGTGAVEFVDHLPELLAELPDPARCESEAATPTLDVEAVEALARGRLRLGIGDSEGARAQAEQAEASASAAGDTRSVLEARALAAWVEIDLGELDEGLRMLRAVADEAELAQLWGDEAEYRTELALMASGAWSKPELERWWLADAELAVERAQLRPEDRRRLMLLTAEARQARARGDYAKARALYEEVSERAAGRDELARFHSRVRMALAGVLRKQGELDEARRVYEGVESRAVELWGPGHYELVHLAYNRGVLELDGGDFEAARRELERARDLARTRMSADAFVSLAIEFALVRLDISTGELEQAAVALDELLPRFEASLGAAHVETARAYNARGVLAFYAGDYPASIAAYERARVGFVEVYGADHDEVGLIHANIGESLAALGRHDEALRALDRGLDILERRLGRDHAYLGPGLKARGKVWIELGARGPAIADLERAEAMLESSGQEPGELEDTRRALAQARALDP